MAASTREEVVAVLDASDGTQDKLCELTFDALTTPELLRVMERLERRERRCRSVRHALINHLATRAGEEELGGKLPAALADRLRITKAEANRWIAEAEDLGERRALTGEPLAPKLTATAAAQRDGLIGDAHIRVIRDFVCPSARRGGCGHPGGRRVRSGWEGARLSA